MSSLRSNHRPQPRHCPYSSCGALISRSSTRPYTRGLGVSRSLPWSRRPEAARLLAHCAHKDRGFDAVVIGKRNAHSPEPSTGLPLRSCGTTGWSCGWPRSAAESIPTAKPTISSCRFSVDSAKPSAHASRAEYATPCRPWRGPAAATSAGRPPYGYYLVPVSPHPNAEKARVGATLNRLEPYPATAPIVQRIFADRLAGAGYTAIARALNTEGILSPSQHDPARNSHRNSPGWADSAVRAILRNARYTGHEVFGRQRREYELIDLSSPAEGHIRRMRWNDPSQWIWSPEATHEPLVSKEEWIRAQSVNTPAKQRAPKAASRPYLLRGRIICAACGRRMHGQTRGGSRRYYRCAARARFPGIADAHTRDLFVAERLVTPLDQWLGELFAPERAVHTAQEIVTALAQGPDRGQEIERARRRITAARRK
jgi:site-specific DNA recombinase